MTRMTTSSRGKVKYCFLSFPSLREQMYQLNTQAHFSFHGFLTQAIFPFFFQLGSQFLMYQFY
jgi:hypothetical protein